MTYILNVCLLSGIFEKSFGVNNFATDYNHLLVELNNSFNFLNREKPDYMTKENEAVFRKSDYRLFCKLAHFFDDFNFFINESVRTRTEHDCKHSVGRRLHDFIRRVESMKIPQQTQDTIAGFLKMQLQKFKFHNSPLQKVIRSTQIKAEKWLLPNLYITETQLEKLAVALNKETEIGEDGLNQFDRTRAQLLQQLAITLKKFPYIRLGQLISNSIPEGNDIFYVTDAKLIQLLKDFEVQHELS